MPTDQMFPVLLSIQHELGELSAKTKAIDKRQVDMEARQIENANTGIKTFEQASRTNGRVTKLEDTIVSLERNISSLSVTSSQNSGLIAKGQEDIKKYLEDNKLMRVSVNQLAKDFGVERSVNVEGKRDWRKFWYSAFTEGIKTIGIILVTLIGWYLAHK